MDLEFTNLRVAPSKKENGEKVSDSRPLLLTTLMEDAPRSKRLPTTAPLEIVND